MVTSKRPLNQDHSSAWIVQTWLSFFISISATSIGIIYLPVDPWIKSFMGRGLAYSVGSTISLSDVSYTDRKRYGCRLLQTLKE